MNLNTLQTIQSGCYVLIFVGAVITGLAGLVNSYVGKSIAEKKDQIAAEGKRDLSRKMESLLKGNDELKSELQPFKDLANKMYPGIETDAALGRLSKELENVKKDIKATVLIPTPPEEKILPDGSMEYKFDLEPEGKNIIPILSITVESKNETKINSISVKGNTIPPMAENKSNKEHTARKILYRAVPPDIFHVTINTQRKTGLAIHIEPFKNKNEQS